MFGHLKHCLVCYVIGFENIRIHCSHLIGFVADIFFFSILESGFKSIRIRSRIRRVPVDGSRIQKEKVADSEISGYPWTRQGVNLRKRLCQIRSDVQRHHGHDIKRVYCTAMYQRKLLHLSFYKRAKIQGQKNGGKKAEKSALKLVEALTPLPVDKWHIP